MPFSPLALFDRFLATPPDGKRTAFLDKQAYAHRGLHGGSTIENSRAAFKAAISLGLGIELDVQAARGSEAVVFHDATLDRLTEEGGAVSKKYAYELAAIRLRNSPETIPGLGEVLALVCGQVPILIEVKSKSASVGSFCLAIRRELEGYRGPFAIMSFNPEIGRWFSEHAPRIVRGLVVTEEDDKGVFGKLKGHVFRHMSLWRAKPDFLAYDIRDLPARFPTGQRKRGLKILTWTVRSAAQEEQALKHADEIIFEQPGSR